MNTCPPSMESLGKQSLLRFLHDCPRPQRYLLAVSGGLDSIVLLELFAQLKASLQVPVVVLHADHKLQQESQHWIEFTAKQAKHHGFDFILLEARSHPDKGDSIENWARNERYMLFSEVMQNKDMLVTAHHLDDQVETFFLQALRGAGPRGLAAMSVLQAFACGWHARPLLAMQRQQLEDFASQQQLQWIEDPSNIDTVFDRNYLRNSVFPILATRWPSYRKTIGRLIEHQAESRQLLDELAQQDLTQLLDEQRRSLDLEALSRLSHARQKNVLLSWARERQLATPNSHHLLQIQTDILRAAMDTNPCVNWADVELRRYRNRLYLFRVLPLHDPALTFTWDPVQVLQLDGETLSIQSAGDAGVNIEQIRQRPLQIRFRQGGEKIRPTGQGVTRSVKQLFQEAGILPWWRDRIPLVYCDEVLAVIPGIAIDERFAAKPGAAACEIIWSGISSSREAHG